VEGGGTSAKGSRRRRWTNARICVSAKAESVTKLTELLVEAQEAGADLLEARLDYLASFSGIERIPGLLGIPVIATLRPAGEGGGFSGDEASRIRILERAGESGFNYLDVELGSAASASLPRRWSTIISWHDHVSTPELEKLEEVLKQALSSGAEIAKVVTTALRSVDNISVLRFLARHARSNKIVSFAMGDEGLPSRILSPLFGAQFAYASLRRGAETAPGQIPLDEFRRTMRELAF